MARRSLRLWSVRRGGGGGTWAAACDAVCSGHADSVEAVAANPAGDAFCSGGWDGALKLWRVADVVSAAEHTDRSLLALASDIES